jgi:hypothetical protein
MQNTGSLPNPSGHDGVYIVDGTAGQSSPLGRENGIFLAATPAGAATHRSISSPFGPWRLSLGARLLHVFWRVRDDLH